MAACRLLPAFVVGGLLMLMTLPAHAATEATSSADAERLLVEMINDRRADAGAPALVARADLHEIARNWSFTQAERDQLGHNPDLTSQACCWTRIAENVARSGGHGGQGASEVARRLMELWRASSGHDQTMTDPEVDQVGLGVVVDDDGTAWGTAVFRRCDGTSCAGDAQGPASDTSVSWAPPPPSPAPAPTAPEPVPEPTPEAEPKAEPTQPPPPTEARSPSPSPSPAPSPPPSPSPSPSPTPTPGPPPTPASASPIPLARASVAGDPITASSGIIRVLLAVAGALTVASAVVANRRP